MKRIMIVLFAALAMTASAQERYNNNHNYGNSETWRSDGRTNYGNQGYGNHGRDDRFMVPPVKGEEAEMVIRLIKSLSFDDKRLETAKVCLALRPMFAEDIARIAKIFSFDDARLKLLEYAYPYCVDPENAELFSDLFTFRSNADKYFDFLRREYKYNRYRR